MQINTQSFIELIVLLNTIWAAPLQIIISIVIIWNYLGVASLVGLGILCLFIPLNIFLANLSKKFRIQKLKQQDTRLKLISDVLNGVKVLKLYGWEKSFNNIINRVREAELKILSKFNLTFSISEFGKYSVKEILADKNFNFFSIILGWNSVSFLVSAVSFIVYIFISDTNILTP